MTASHYYTQQGPAVKWALPLISSIDEIPEPLVKYCEQCGREMTQGDLTNYDWKFRKFCSRNCVRSGGRFIEAKADVAELAEKINKKEITVSQALEQSGLKYGTFRKRVIGLGLKMVDGRKQ